MTTAPGHDHRRLAARIADLLGGDGLGYPGGSTDDLAEALARIDTEGSRLDGEPVWPERRRKTLVLELESPGIVDSQLLGVADRPSEVARLLRQAAADIEAEWR